MKVIHAAIELGNGHREVSLAIGVFDGVHLGHQQIIRQTVADARQHDGVAVVLTFDQHPNAIIAPDRLPPLIYSQSQKVRAIELLDADALLVKRFDRAFSDQTGESFIRSLVRDFGQLQSVCVGADFVFGYKRSGNVALLRQLARELNFTVHGVSAVSLDNRVVSSTRIREAIRLGDFDSASQMLGRPYSLAGQVVHGDQLGRKLGIPTANLDMNGLLLPPTGVYAAHALVRGSNHRAVVNIGHRPTLQNPAPELRLEIHLLNFNAELYGEEVEVTFASKLRDERRFASLDELKAQVSHDIAEAQRRF